MHAWLRLTNLQLPARLGNALLDAFGSPEAIFDASPARLGETDAPGLTDNLITRILDPAFSPTDRQLSDDMTRAVAARGGVIGINFFDKFLLPPAEYGTRRATLADVTRHVQHVCDLVGNTTCVGIGTDMDGGLGREQIPVEIATSADLPRVAEALSAAGFGDGDVGRIMGANWLHFFARALPRGAAGG